MTDFQTALCRRSPRVEDVVLGGVMRPVQGFSLTSAKSALDGLSADVLALSAVNARGLLYVMIAEDLLKDAGVNALLDALDDTLVAEIEESETAGALGENTLATLSLVSVQVTGYWRQISAEAAEAFGLGGSAVWCFVAGAVMGTGDFEGLGGGRHPLDTAPATGALAAA